MQLQTDEQRGKGACALTARGSISKVMKGLVEQRKFPQIVERSGLQP